MRVVVLIVAVVVVVVLLAGVTPPFKHGAVAATVESHGTARILSGAHRSSSLSSHLAGSNMASSSTRFLPHHWIKHTQPWQFFRQTHPPLLSSRSWYTKKQSTRANVQDDSPVERSALEQLFWSLDGPNWINNTNWLQPNVSVCNWAGVHCDNSSRVSSLLLPENGLSGALDAPQVTESLCALQQLRELWLYNNALTGSIPFGSLQCLTRLLVLILYSNQLSGTISPDIGRLTSLEVMDLSQNSLSGSLPVELGNLTSLKQLWAYSVPLTGQVPLRELGRLQALQELWLYQNSFTGTIPAFEATDFPQLRVLDLDTNFISGTIPSGLSHLPALTELWLFAMELNGTIPAELGSCSTLNQLWLQDNMLSGTLPPELGQLSKLRILDLARNEISGLVPDSFQNMVSLQVLDLNHNLVGPTPPWSLMLLPSLESLHLSNNLLEGIGGCVHSQPPGLMTGISVVDFSRNPLGGDINELLSCFKIHEKLSFLLMSSSELTGAFSSETIVSSVICEVDDAGTVLCHRDYNFQNLVELDISDNLISGTLPSSLDQIRLLQSVNASRNHLVGRIPETLGFFVMLDLRGNTAMNAPELPWFIRADDNVRVVYEQNGLECTGFTSNGNNVHIHVYLDPNYLNFSVCRCSNSSWYWNATASRCFPCPTEHLICSPFVAGLPLHTPEEGYYPVVHERLATDTNILQASLLECVEESYCRGFRVLPVPLQPPSNSSSHIVVQFQCASGHDPNSLLCSRCSPSYFAIGTSCIRCTPFFLGVAPTLELCVIVLFLIYLWRRDEAQQSTYSTLQIFIFWLQVTSVLDRSEQVASSIYAFHEMANFGPNAFACWSSQVDFISTFWMILAMPLFLGIVLLLARIGIRKHEARILVNSLAPEPVAALMEAAEAEAEADTRAELEQQSAYQRLVESGEDEEHQEEENQHTPASAIAPVLPSTDISNSGQLTSHHNTQPTLQVPDAAARKYPTVQRMFSSRSMGALDDYKVQRRTTGPLAAATLEAEPMLLRQLSDPDKWRSTSMLGFESRLDRRLSKAMFIFYFMLSTLYFSLSQRVLSIFNCVDGAGVSYLSAAPYVSCNSSEYLAMKAAAIIGLVLYVFGIPVWFFYQVWLHHIRADVRTLHELGFLWRAVHPLYYWWEVVVVMGRKLVLAMVLALLPRKSIFLSISAVCVLMLAALLQALFRPYHHRLDNVLEVVILVVALPIAYSSVLSNVGGSFFSSSDLSNWDLARTVLLQIFTWLQVLILARLFLLQVFSESRWCPAWLYKPIFRLVFSERELTEHSRKPTLDT